MSFFDFMLHQSISFWLRLFSLSLMVAVVILFVMAAKTSLQWKNLMKITAAITLIFIMVGITITNTTYNNYIVQLHKIQSSSQLDVDSIFGISSTKKSFDSEILDFFRVNYKDDINT